MKNLQCDSCKKFKLNKDYTPLPIYEGDEIYPNGIFNFSISRIMEDIESGKLIPRFEKINIQAWFKFRSHGSINEEHLPTVDITKPIIQAQIRPDTYEVIDGNHRLEKAFRDGLEYIDSYKLCAEQLLPYFKEVRGYKAYVEYWNQKIKDIDHDAKRYAKMLEKQTSVLEVKSDGKHK